MKKKNFNNLYEESQNLHREINKLIRVLIVENIEDLDNMDEDDKDILLRASSITKSTLDLLDNTCKKLDDMDKKLDDINKKIDKN